MDQIGVYLIELNNKKYVGSSARSIKKRWSAHLSFLRTGTHRNIHLQRAFNKYGEDAVNFSIVEVIETPEDCIILEQKWIDELSPEYNICPIAGSRLGTKASVESKQKMSDSQKGNRNKLGHKLSEESKQKMSDSQKGHRNKLGHKLSEESKQKIREANLGKKASVATRQKMSEAHKGHKTSEETRHKISIAKTNTRYKKRAGI